MRSRYNIFSWDSNPDLKFSGVVLCGTPTQSPSINSIYWNYLVFRVGGLNWHAGNALLRNLVLRSGLFKEKHAFLFIQLNLSFMGYIIHLSYISVYLIIPFSVIVYIVICHFMVIIETYFNIFHNLFFSLYIIYIYMRYYILYIYY